MDWRWWKCILIIEYLEHLCNRDRSPVVDVHEHDYAYVYADVDLGDVAKKKGGGPLRIWGYVWGIACATLVLGMARSMPETRQPYLQKTESHHASGLLQLFVDPVSVEFQSSTTPSSLNSDPDAGAHQFLAARVWKTHSPYQWSLFQKHQLGSNLLYRFALSYDSVPLQGIQVMLEVEPSGRVILARSDLAISPPSSLPAFPAASDEKKLLRQAIGSVGTASVVRRYRKHGEVWRAVLEVGTLGGQEHSKQLRRFPGRRLIVDAETGAVLSEPRLVRRLDAKVFAVSPYNAGGNNGAPVLSTLPSLTASATTLRGANIYVRREEQSGSSYAFKDIFPTSDFYSDSTFREDPAVYGSLCVGNSSECPNQGIDAVSVYAHVQGFRVYVDSLLSEQEITGALPSESLDVFINVRSFDSNNDGSLSDEPNTAAYIPAPCFETSSIARCLIFTRPTSGTATICGSSVVQFYDLAREAIVAVHEYQHYVTDMIAGLVPGENDYNVGDALHEGYSDYFGASYVSYTSGTTSTKVGEYAFQECPAIQRDIGTLQTFTSANKSLRPHSFGQTWASGLWQLREEYGRDITDRIALRSLFYLPKDPGYAEAVEALALADNALYSGEHSTRIRELFFDELKFVSGKSSLFRDARRGIVEVGIQSCASGRPPTLGSKLESKVQFAFSATGLVFFWGWLWGVCGIGRLWFHGFFPSRRTSLLPT